MNRFYQACAGGQGFVQQAHYLGEGVGPDTPRVRRGGQRGNFDKLGDMAAFNGDGSHVKTPGRPSMVTEYGSVSCRRPGEYAPGWGI